MAQNYLLIAILSTKMSLVTWALGPIHTHNWALGPIHTQYCDKKIFSLKYCSYMSKSFKNKQQLIFSIHTVKKNIGWKISFYRNIACKNIVCDGGLKLWLYAGVLFQLKDKNMTGPSWDFYNTLGSRFRYSTKFIHKYLVIHTLCW